MNAKQAKAIEQFRANVLSISNGHEVKEERVNDDTESTGMANMVFYTLDTGLPNDNGSYLFMCREHWFVNIGERGAVYAYGAPKHCEQFKGRKALGITFRNDCYFSN